MTTTVALAGITLDCPDPQALAAFYGKLAGWRAVYESDDYVALAIAEADGAPAVGFQRVEHHVPPQWPDGTPQQFHLDFFVDELDAAQDSAVALGARPAGFQPQADRWRVLLDPAGHPFCLSKKPS